MFSTIFLLLLVSFYLLYNLSARMKVASNTPYLSYLHRRPFLTRIISLSLIVLSIILLIWQLGIGAGIFGLVVILMATGSLVVTLTPFRYFRLPHVLASYLLFLIFEIFIF